MSDPAAILEVLDRAGYHATEPRRAIVELIAAQPGRFTAEELVQEAADAKPKVGRATVFRSLEILEALGLVERVHLARSDHAYVVCDPDHHHHHLVCERCGRSVELRDVGIGPIAKAVEESTGYRVDSHRFELFGLCPVCQGKLSASA